MGSWVYVWIVCVWRHRCFRVLSVCGVQVCLGVYGSVCGTRGQFWHFVMVYVELCRCLWGIR